MSSAATLFTLHEASESTNDAVRLSPHRFSWVAFWLGPLWLAVKGLWFLAALFLFVDVLIGAGAGAGWIGPAGTTALWALAHLLIGLEAQEWRRRALSQSGSSIVGFSYGVDEIDALARAAFSTPTSRRTESVS